MKNFDKKLLGTGFLIALVIGLTSMAVGSMLTPKSKVLGKQDDKPTCTTIQSGTLLTSAGVVIPTGFDEWGYNYQARMFSGGYCDAYRNASWCQAYKEDDLIMKWNDAWLSNKDCNNDNLLDRHLGFISYRGSGAWLTNHMSGSYIGEDEKEHHWTYFTKIVAVPEDAVLDDGIWISADGKEIGPVIWGEFATIEEIYNDPYEGFNGKSYLSPSGPGFGKY